MNFFIMRFFSLSIFSMHCFLLESCKEYKTQIDKISLVIRSWCNITDQKEICSVNYILFMSYQVVFSLSLMHSIDRLDLLKIFPIFSPFLSLGNTLHSFFYNSYVSICKDNRRRSSYHQALLYKYL